MVHYVEKVEHRHIYLTCVSNMADIERVFVMLLNFRKVEGESKNASSRRNIFNEKS